MLRRAPPEILLQALLSALLLRGLLRHLQNPAYANALPMYRAVRCLL